MLYYNFKISLKKIEQIYNNSCLKIFSYFNGNSSLKKLNLNDESYMLKVKSDSLEIIKSNKLTNGIMNEIFQANDDFKYRTHNFKVTSEAKEFCVNLIKIEKIPYNIVSRMCNIPKINLKRWISFGTKRIKGSGRKIKKPKILQILFQWHNEYSNKGIDITGEMIKNKAIELDKTFVCSNCWLHNFKKKFNLKINSKKAEEKKNISN